MRLPKIAYALILCPGICSAATETNVHWESMGDNQDADGWHYIQKITVTGDTDMKGLAFNQFARKMNMLNPADTLTEIVPGYYLITSTRFNEKGDSVIFEIDTRGYMINCSYAPDGFHRVMHDNTAAPVNLTRARLTDHNIHHAFDIAAYPKAETIYAWNESLRTDWQPGVYDIIPSFKEIVINNSGATVIDPEIIVETDAKYAKENRPNHTTIEVKDNKAVIRAGSARAAKIANNIFTAKVLRPNKGKQLPEATLVFDPDFEWRGVMIDIARNYQQPETILDILQIMADNGMNKFHFHPVDDEAWRLEIPSLPELTNVGSRRGWGTNEDDHLYQIFTGDGNPDNLDNSSNGYFTKADFIRMLQFADSLGIDVLTEIESPGHARAAIRAMESRAKKGDAAYRLIHDNDTSKYTSAQSFHDNVMNPALESTYKFMETVIDDVIGMYKEAGVPLIGIHIGGDEVPRGAWNGSEVAKKFMDENGISNEKELHAYFVKQIAKMLSERDVPMFGWQEIAIGHSDEFNAEVAPKTGGVNTWSTLVKEGETPVPVKSIMGGFPTILSNVDHFYFDLSYSAHPEEPGLSWGGHTSEFTAFEGYADKLCPITEDAPGKVIGVNAQIFAETMRNGDQMLMYLTPKILGIAERGANKDTTYTVPEFNSIIGTKELSSLEEYYKTTGRGRVHVNQPGILIKENVVYMNAPYAGGEIRYTTDGTDPNENSALYSSPFEYDGTSDIKARYFRNGAKSETTYSKK